MNQLATVSADVLTARCELAGEILRSFGSLRFVATGWSMLPTVWSGDTLVVDRITPHQFRVGDIALVGRNGKLCAHRVVSVPKGSGSQVWITQGDAMRLPDRPVIESELLGRVTKLIRSGKCVEAPANLNVIERALARIVRRSVFTARVFVYWIGRAQSQREPVLTCQG